MKIGVFADLDKREQAILSSIFQVQLEEPKGISWGHLLELDPIKKLMSRQTFSFRLQGLIQMGLVKKEVIRDRRGKPTLYRLDSRLFAELKEFRDKFYPWSVDSEIQRFQRDVETLETSRYVDATMELALGRLSVLAIALTAFETEGARWLFYEATYQQIERLLRGILERSSKSKEDKSQTLNKLFDLLDAFAGTAIGKRFGLDGVSRSRHEIIKAIVGEAGAPNSS
ncbi:MAG: hypothetical protein NWE95_11780 [Candidatus Bathyarchaeota archaeon]|nr:hypothetical protein [Candidatus Bathyarchaeota archaeon]